MAKDLTTTVFEPIWPTGLALDLLIVTIVFTAVSSMVVCLRFYVRYSSNSFSVEDWIMFAGWILNLAHNGAVMVLPFVGIGSYDDVITVGMMYKIGLWTIIWQFLYVLDGALIKSSIIWTLLRLARNLNHIYRYILWSLFGFTWIVWQISWPVAIFQCRPVAAAWGAPGSCTSGQKVILNVSYFVSVANIFTDLSTTILPILLLRHLQLPRKVKILTIGVLCLGAIASVATIIRITYTWAYTTTNNKYYQIGKIVLLTVLECDLGIIAGSMPMLRRLFRSLAGSSSHDQSGKSRDVNLRTIGGTKRTHIKLTNAGTHVDGSEQHFVDKDSNGDDESTRHIIHITREIEQDSVSGRDVPVGGQFHVAASGSSTPGQNANQLGASREWGRST